MTNKKQSSQVDTVFKFIELKHKASKLKLDLSVGLKKFHLVNPLGTISSSDLATIEMCIDEVDVELPSDTAQALVVGTLHLFGSPTYINKNSKRHMVVGILNAFGHAPSVSVRKLHVKHQKRADLQRFAHRFMVLFTGSHGRYRVKKPLTKQKRIKYCKSKEVGRASNEPRKAVS